MALFAFYALSLVTVVCALMVVLANNPFSSAVALIASLFGVAGLFALASYGFLAVLQILIYAGAIVTLFIFVVMLLNLRNEELQETGVTIQKLTGGVVAALLAVNLAMLANVPAPGGTAISEGDTFIFELAQMVFGNYGLAFELISILLLVALVGVIALARREKA